MQHTRPVSELLIAAPEELPTTSLQAQKTSQIRRCDSRDLFGGARELLIEHAGNEYRLRLTSQGKLVLTK